MLSFKQRWNCIISTAYTVNKKQKLKTKKINHLNYYKHNYLYTYTLKMFKLTMIQKYISHDHMVDIYSYWVRQGSCLLTKGGKPTQGHLGKEYIWPYHMPVIYVHWPHSQLSCRWTRAQVFMLAGSCIFLGLVQWLKSFC